ncbi:signal peptidase I [Kineococcus sp. SYSU DK005]|uniref:signal peptidase I n=1 Tax=Kineococcus sp. SYSU DK005 TaxID=3383126 RepID=UPI003D7F1589
MSAGHDAPEQSAGEHEPQRPARGGGVLAAVRETVLVVAVALVVSLVVKTFLLQAFYIPSQSMERTLDIGDRVVVSKLTPGPFALHRGDVVVFADPGGWLAATPEPQRSPLGAVAADVLTFVGLLPEDSDDHLIKRVIGLPGDHVVCCDAQGRTTVNDVAVDERAYLYPGAEPSLDEFDVTVPAGRLWVMGDNRAESADSRYNRQKEYDGFVPLDHVVGRAYAVVWPLPHAAWLGTPGAFDDVPGRTGVG